MSRQADSSQLAGRYIRKQGRSIGGFHRTVLRFQPPLTIPRDQLECGVESCRTTIEASRDEAST
ncbi:hypothetical protein [Halobellus ordinarius]|uniref:hypothetical protein n=1 Tax=Halobellus ordinarius TaxID=3075120 RepID=UPI0028801336|nr:hypothetical protein [Halobellus sp. ZY16]